MVRFAVATVVVTVLIASSLFSQDAPSKVQVFGGYSFVDANSAGLTGTILDVALLQPPNTFQVNTNRMGWNAQAQYNLDRWIGIVADFSGRYGKPFTGAPGVTGLPNSSAYSILFGPAISYRTKSKFTPYVHTLFGWDRSSLSSTTIIGPASPVLSSAASYNDFAMALGGGLDFKVAKRFSLRAAQVDWFHTSVNFNKFYGGIYDTNKFEGVGTHQDNIRISTGFVAQF